jgi:hypothetical protein
MKKRPVGRPPSDLAHGRRFQRQLKRSGLSLSDIAHAFGMSRQAVYGWKDTGVSANRVSGVAFLFDCSVRDLRPDVYKDYDARR